MTNPARDQFQRALKAAPKLPRNCRLIGIRRRQGTVTLRWMIVRGDKTAFLTTQSTKNTLHPQQRGAV